MALNPEMTDLVGKDTMLCDNSNDNKYLIKGLDNGTSQREVAQTLLNTINWSVKPLNPTKGLDKRRPDYIVCANTPPQPRTFAWTTNGSKLQNGFRPRLNAPTPGTGGKRNTVWHQSSGTNLDTTNHNNPTTNVTTTTTTTSATTTTTTTNTTKTTKEITAWTHVRYPQENQYDNE